MIMLLCSLLLVTGKGEDVPAPAHELPQGFCYVHELIDDVILDIRYLLKNGIEECNGSCSSCGTSCKWVGDVNKARKAAALRRKLKAFFHLS